MPSVLSDSLGILKNSYLKCYIRYSTCTVYRISVFPNGYKTKTLTAEMMINSMPII